MDKILTVKLWWLVCIATLIMTFGCGEESGNGEGNKAMLAPVDLLPDDNDISGWESIGAYEEANDYDGLYDIINGGAEVFIDNGFVSAAFQTYNECLGGVCSTALVHLRIYDQGTEAGAQAVYDRTATGIGIPWDGAGTEARVDESGLASYMVEFWYRNLFAQVIIEEKSDDALNVAKLFAAHISDLIGW